MRILIVGGYGTFGGRLVELLADEARVTLLVAGRSLAKAAERCRLPAAARLEPVAFDRAGDLAAQLAVLTPDLVVDASGPFQAYGGDGGPDPYALVRAALAAGADYLDLADAAAFALGIDVLDAQAKTRGRFVLSAVSSFPVLTAAVVRRLAAGLQSVEAIAGGIAPSPYAAVGLNVVRAIASYTGKPVTYLADGRPAIGHGFVDSRRMTVAVPGRVPLPPIRFGLLEVPDTTLLARDWPTARSVWMGAGPTPAALHRLLWLAGWLVRLRLVPSMLPFAGVMHRVMNAVRWGEHRGGMIVEVRGLSSRGAETRSWHMIAEGDVGPLIPSMAAEAIIRRCLAGERPGSGARPGHHDLELADYEALFARRGIATGMRVVGRDEARRPIYARVMGPALARLSAPIRALHDLAPGGEARYAGRAAVERGRGRLANAVASLFGFPPAMADAAIEVRLTADGGVETWRRTFAGKSFASTQEAGRGRFVGLLVERFGPLAFGLAVTETAGRLDLQLRRWSAFGLPLPLRLAPTTEAGEHDAGGRFNFSVEIALPLLGRLVHYRGWLEPVAASATQAGEHAAT